MKVKSESHLIVQSFQFLSTLTRKTNEISSLFHIKKIAMDFVYKMI